MVVVVAGMGGGALEMFLIFYCLCLPFSKAARGGGHDAPLLRAADVICTSPPFDARARSLVRRLPGYDRMLDTIVDQCPDVAMIFAEFSVGATSPSWRRPVLDYLWRLDFPTLRVEAENH